MSWFKDLKVAIKLGIGFGVIALLLVFSGVAGVVGVTRVRDAAVYMHDKHAAGLRLVLLAQSDLLRIARETRSAMLDREPAAIVKRQQLIKELDTSFKHSFDEYETTIVSPADQQKAKELQEIYTRLRKEQDDAVEEARQGDPKEALEQLYGLNSLAKEFDTRCTELVDSKEAKMTESLLTMERIGTTVFWACVIMTLFGLAAAVLIGMFLSGSIATTTSELGRAIAAAEGGDFTTRAQVTGHDELGEAAKKLNQLLDTLRGTMGQVVQSSAAVALAAKELSGGARQISDGAQEQAASLEETAASLEEVTSTVTHNAQHAQQATQLANDSRVAAEQGSHVVESAVLAMDELNKSAKKIAEIISTIDEIAFQTNLLALNAAVEAARAGEQGRGFAVVAAEVRALAQRASGAAKEIRGLIQDSLEKVDSGTQLVHRCGHTLDEIVTSARSVASIIGEIAGAANEQAVGIEQINKAVVQMDQVTQVNASQTEELNATAEGLAGESRQMADLVSRFKIGDTRTAAVAATHTSPPHKPVLTLHAGHAATPHHAHDDRRAQAY